MRFNDCTTNEGYVALQAWLGGQMTPRAPHATQLFAEDQECLYDVFLSVLVGTGMGFDDFDDNRAHHGLYAFDFLVGDVEMPSALPLSAADVDGQVDEAGGGSALCHALVDTWRGSVGLRVPFVSVVLAAASTLELVAELRVDSCVFVFDLPPGYAADTAPMPWEHGGLPIGSVDSSLLVPGPTIRVEAHDPSSRSPLTSTDFAAALGKSVEMGLVVGTAQASDSGVSALLRAPHTRPEMLGWAADAVARALSECGHVGALQIRAWLGGSPA